MKGETRRSPLGADGHRRSSLTAANGWLLWPHLYADSGLAVFPSFLNDSAGGGHERWERVQDVNSGGGGGGGEGMVGGENSGGSCLDSSSPQVDGGGAPISAPASEDSTGGGGPAGYRASSGFGDGSSSITDDIYGYRSLWSLLVDDKSDGKSDGQLDEFDLDEVLPWASVGGTEGGDVYGDRSLRSLLLDDRSDGESDGQLDKFDLDDLLLGARGGGTEGEGRAFGFGGEGDSVSARTSMVTPTVAESGGGGSAGSNARYPKSGARLGGATYPGQLSTKKHSETVGEVDEMREVR